MEGGCNKADLVLHNGCIVSGVIPYALLRDANVSSTVSCLRMAAARCRRLVFVSSLSALMGGEREAPLSGKDLSMCAVMSGYGSSKRVSELLVEQARPWLRQCVIVRPGSIGGSTELGALSPNDTLARYMMGICEMKMAPHFSRAVLISVVPVDFVASAIVDQCCLARECPSVLHLFGDVSFSAQDLADCARSVGFEIVETTWSHFMKELERSKSLSPLRSYFSGGFPIGVDGKHTTKSISVPTVGAKDLVRYYEWLASRGLITPQ